MIEIIKKLTGKYSIEGGSAAYELYLESKGNVLDEITNENDLEFAIYFLMKKDIVVYVGETERSLRKRYLHHRRKKHFGVISFINFKKYKSKFKIKQVETALINYFRPELNLTVEISWDDIDFGQRPSEFMPEEYLKRFPDIDLNLNTNSKAGKGKDPAYIEWLDKLLVHCEMNNEPFGKYLEVLDLYSRKSYLETIGKYDELFIDRGSLLRHFEFV